VLLTDINTRLSWNISIGNGNEFANESGKIKLNIPDDLLIQDSGDPLRSLIDFVYPDFLKNMKKPKFFQEHVYFPQLWIQSNMLMIISYRWSPKVSKNVLALTRFINQMQIARYTVNISQLNS
jgi:hypothetical protein